MRHFVIKDMEAKKPVQGVEMRVIPGNKMTMVFFFLEPGAEIPEHAHPHEQMGTVLKGSIELVVDKEKRIVNEGEAYHVLPDVVHSGQCGEAPAEIIEVFSPARKAYH
ncbi:MAG: cupin domain-containing protein [Desulfobacteraceae bacterium]|jgi:quercetin dioxygenase-like cupin family protein